MHNRHTKTLWLLTGLCLIAAGATESSGSSDGSDSDEPATTPESPDGDTAPLSMELPWDLTESGERHMRGIDMIDKSYVVSLQQFRRFDWHHYCGGAIISASHVLTAANCIDGVDLSTISAVAGSYEWRQGGVRLMVLARRVHPRYSVEPSVVNNIAVLRVGPSFPSAFQPLELGGPMGVGAGAAVTVYGWGSTSPDEDEPNVPSDMQMLSYTTISNDECRQRGVAVTSAALCVFAAKGTGICLGDGGAPLLMEDEDGNKKLVGIASYGSSKCAQGWPDVYTRISNYLPFINRVITYELL